MSKCTPDKGEPSFHLLGRDRHAPHLVREWARSREAEGEPKEVTDEARKIADDMETYAETRRVAKQSGAKS